MCVHPCSSRAVTATVHRSRGNEEGRDARTPVARRDWRLLTGRSPDSRRVPRDRPHRLPTGISGSGCRLACVMRLAPFTVAGAVPGWRATRAPASRLARLAPGTPVIAGHSGQAHRGGQAAVDEAARRPAVWPHGELGKARRSARSRIRRGGSDPRAPTRARSPRARKRTVRRSPDARPRGRSRDPRDRRGALSAGWFLRRGIRRGRALDARACLDRRPDRRHQVLRAPLPDVLDADRRDAPRAHRARRFLARRSPARSPGPSAAPARASAARRSAVSRIARARAGDAFHRKPPLARGRAALGGVRASRHAPRPHPRLRRFPRTTTCSAVRQDRRRARVRHPRPRTSRRLSVIVEEAGGRVTDLEGAPIGLGTRSILATNGVHCTISISRGPRRLGLKALTNTRCPAPREFADRHS